MKDCDLPKIAFIFVVASVFHLNHIDCIFTMIFSFCSYHLGVSKNAVQGPKGFATRTLNVWMGPGFMVPHMMLTIGTCADGSCDSCKYAVNGDDVIPIYTVHNICNMI